MLRITLNKQNGREGYVSTHSTHYWDVMNGCEPKASTSTDPELSNIVGWGGGESSRKGWQPKASTGGTTITGGTAVTCMAAAGKTALLENGLAPNRSVQMSSVCGVVS